MADSRRRGPRVSETAREEARRHSLLRLIHELERLWVGAERERPLKDAAAHNAMKVASMLMDAHAGWARDHVIGRVIKGIPSVPYAGGTQRERSLGHDRPWDDPQLEDVGRKYDWSDDSLNRRILIELLHGYRRLFGSTLTFHLIEAFEALEAGDQHPLVTPNRRRREHAHEIAQLRVRAIKYAAFRHGTGMSKMEAFGVVAAAYGIGTPPETDAWKIMEGWQTRIVETLDLFRKRDFIERAFNNGQWFTELAGKPELPEIDHAFRQELEEEYGDESMYNDGERFRKLVPASRRKKHS